MEIEKKIKEIFFVPIPVPNFLLGMMMGGRSE